MWRPADLCAAGMTARPHGQRHAAITSALDATLGNVRAVQRFSRHADVRTPQVYDDNREDLGGKVAALVAALGRLKKLSAVTAPDRSTYDCQAAVGIAYRSRHQAHRNPELAASCPLDWTSPRNSHARKEITWNLSPLEAAAISDALRLTSRHCSTLPFGAVVCVVTLTGAYRVTEHTEAGSVVCVDAALPGSAPVALLRLGPGERHLGDFQPGQWLWLLADVQLLVPPRPANGQQRLWRWVQS
jgi:hypothetical protein